VKRGRLTLAQQREQEVKLRDCFLKGYTESATIVFSGIGKNTVSKYFKKWNDELLVQDRKEFYEGMDNAKYRLRLALDRQLQKSYKIQDDINDELENTRLENNGKIPTGKGLYKERMMINEKICKCLSVSFGVSVTPIVERLEGLIYKEYELLEKKQYEEEEEKMNRARIQRKRLHFDT